MKQSTSHPHQHCPLLDQVSIDFQPGSYFSDPGLPQEERRLATLTEVGKEGEELEEEEVGKDVNLQVLQEFPSTQVNIDLKDPEQELVDRVMEVIKKSGAEERSGFAAILLLFLLSFSPPSYFSHFLLPPDVCGGTLVRPPQSCVSRPTLILASSSPSPGKYLCLPLLLPSQSVPAILPLLHRPPAICASQGDSPGDTNAVHLL